MIGMYALLYSSQAEAVRAFVRGKLGLVGTDVGGGWLTLGAPEAEPGVHPTDGGVSSGPSDVSFFTVQLCQPRYAK